MGKENLKVIREYWGVSASLMSKICGFGINQWREYESGQATPNKSNGLMLMLVASPFSFRDLLKQLSEDDKSAMGSKYNKLLEQANTACSMINRKVEDYRQELAGNWIK